MGIPENNNKFSLYQEYKQFEKLEEKEKYYNLGRNLKMDLIQASLE